MYKRLYSCFLLLFAVLSLPVILQAQVGTTTDIVTGRVVGPAGAPMADIDVVAQSVETGVTRRARTDHDGHYTIVFPDGGGQYHLTVRAIGFQPISRDVARHANEDRMVANMEFATPLTTRLTPVTVSAGRDQGKRPAAGESGRDLDADQLSRLPVDASDLASVASLAPGVLPIVGSDSSASSFSVMGQRPTLNAVTLDGLSSGGFTAPAEGIRSTNVVTSTYDVSRGQFSGGLIASTTRSGTNKVTGGITYSRRDPALEFPGTDSSILSPLLVQDQIGAGLGGPIIKNRLFIFGSAQLRRRSSPFQSLLSDSPGALAQLGLQNDSASSFLTTVHGYGIPLNTASSSDRQVGLSGTGLVRIDYILTQRQTLTLRADGWRNTREPVGGSPFALPTASGSRTATGDGLAAILTSSFTNGLINAVSVYSTRSVTASDPFLLLPSGTVLVASQLPGETAGNVALNFGGTGGASRYGSDRLLELTDELSYLTHNAAHRIKFGGLLDLSSGRQEATSNIFGAFIYNTLQDFENNTPASYTRTLSPNQTAGHATSGALYLGDSWQPWRGAQVDYGLRAEGTWVGQVPQFNPDILQRFGLRTDHFPSEIHFSPRAGFSVGLGNSSQTGGSSQGTTPFTLRGGVGEFRATAPTSLYTSARAGTGLANTAQQLTCVGAAIPVPEWSVYGTNPSAIPGACVDGSGTLADLAATQTNITVFDPTFKTPRSWKASLGLERHLFSSITISADATYARGVSLYGVTDLNLNSTSAFLLADERDRPVYVPASAIVPATGAVSPTASRKDPQYGNVFEVSSDLKSYTHQLTLSLVGAPANGTSFNLSYTIASTRDQSTSGFSLPITAGNPNISGWGPGDNGPRHIIHGSIIKPISSSLELTAFASLYSGEPFTPLINSDINGDRATNDRAFVFNPQTTADTAVASAMQQLLTGAPMRVRNCLRAQLGTIAGRNSCDGPWFASFDLQANMQPDGFGLHRRVRFSLSTVNMLAGLDQLMHGSNLHGWGEYGDTDPTLLYVQGFDPATQRFRYAVNERFGSTSASQVGFRAPFAVTLQARLLLGPESSTATRHS